MFFECILFFFVVLCSADIDEQLLFCRNSPAKLLHGHIKRDRVSYYAGQGYLGSMEYICLPGFELIGNGVMVCQNGQWSPMPQCAQKKRCLPIQSYPAHTRIERENLIRDSNDPRQILAGSTVTLQCEGNRHFQGTKNQTLIVSCLNDGTWTVMDHCQYKQTTCDYAKLYLPTRSRITRMNFQFSETNRQFHTVGSSLEYTCEDGYRLHDGQTSLIVQCLPSGSWSPLPVCEFVHEVVSTPRCPYPIYIQNGFIALYNVTIWEDRTYTGRIVYECNYGFETSPGEDQMVSDCVDGTWTRVEDCQSIPTCPKEALLAMESQAENSYVYNVSLQYIRDPLAFVYDSYVFRVCLPQHEHDPSSPPLKIQCQRHSNTWTGVPICRAIPTSTVSTVLTQTITTDTQSITTTETRTETTHTITCNGRDVPKIPNATITPSHDNQIYNIGTRLDFLCESSSNQSSFIICKTDGTWSIDALNFTMCEPEFTSTLPSEDETILLKISSTPMDPLSETTTAFDDYLPILNFSDEALISSTRAIAGSDRQVRHLISSCDEIPQIEHAQLLSDEIVSSRSANSTTYHGSVVVKCQYGFVSDVNNSNEAIRITCANGQFSPRLTCREKPRCSISPPIDLKRASIITSQIHVFDSSTNEAIPGSFILLKCSETETFNMTCADSGQWILPPSSCLIPFKRRCSASISIPNARTQIYGQLTSDGYYVDGTRAIYRCLDNFAHDTQSGPLYMQCKNGRWGPRPRCLPNGCLDALPDQIEHGWKSGESYVIHDDQKYYHLTRYSCHANATRIGTSSSSTIDIQCRSNQWQYETLALCQLKE